MEITKETINNVRKEGFRPGVVGVFVNSHKVLLLNKSDWKLWLFAQGGIDNNEDVNESISREMKEELGIDFVHTWAAEPILLFEDRIAFRSDLHDTRKLNLDGGEEVKMLGKHYYYFVVPTNTQEIDITKTDFDESKWLTYDEALALAASIYQKNKKKALVKALELLKSNGFIK